MKFSLRTMLITVAVIAITCAFFNSRLRYFRQQQEVKSALYSVGVRPYPPTFHSTGPITHWLLGDQGFSIDGFIVGYDPVDELLAQASNIDGLQIEGVSVNNQAQGVGGGLAPHETDPIHLGLAGVRAMAKIQSVRSLDVTGTEISDDALRNMNLLTRLERLTLPGRTRDEDIVLLPIMPSLRSLDLRNSFVTDRCLAVLANQPSLLEVDVGHTRVTEAGAATLKSLCPGIDIVNVGLEQNSYLTFFQQSVTAVRAGKSDTILVPNALRDEDLQAITGLPLLKRLYLGDSCTGEVLAHITSPKALEVLVLGNRPLTADQLSQFGRFTSLKELNLSGTCVDSAMLIQLLPHLTELERLEVNGCKIDDTIMPALLRCQHLKEVWLEDTDVSQQAEEFFYEQKQAHLIR